MSDSEDVFVRSSVGHLERVQCRVEVVLREGSLNDPVVKFHGHGVSKDEVDKVHRQCGQPGPLQDLDWTGWRLEGVILLLHHIVRAIRVPIKMMLWTFIIIEVDCPDGQSGPKKDLDGTW